MRRAKPVADSRLGKIELHTHVGKPHTDRKCFDPISVIDAVNLPRATLSASAIRVRRPRCVCFAEMIAGADGGVANGAADAASRSVADLFVAGLRRRERGDGAAVRLEVDQGRSVEAVETSASRPVYSVPGRRADSSGGRRSPTTSTALYGVPGLRNGPS
jgi:hypothetical protein